MKIVPFVFAALLSAGPFGYCQASQSDKAAQDGVSRKAVQVLRGELGMDLIDIRITEANVNYQDHALANAVRFQEALRSAMDNFLNDFEDPEGVLAQCIEKAAEELGEELGGPVSKKVLKRAKQLAFAAFNSPETTIRLLSTREKPEQGESVTENWVFYVYLAAFSDHGHWAVVDRSGRSRTYSYSFN